jgi:hypothetical protein
MPDVWVKIGGQLRLGGFGFHEQADPPSSEILAAPAAIR